MTTPRNQKSRVFRVRRLKTLIATRIAVVAVGVLVLGEAIARLALTSPSSQDFDRELSWVWRPGAVIYNNSEGGAPITINSLGLNDNEITDKGSRFRVVGLGNSFMEAIQVPLDLNYTSLLEQRVYGLDFVNLARSAMGPAHYPIVLERFAPLLAPDFIVVGLGEGDVQDLVSDHVITDTTKEGDIRGVSVRVDKKDRIKAAFRGILDNSAFATYTMRRLKPLFLDTARSLNKLFGPRKDEAKSTSSNETMNGNVAANRLTFILRKLKRTAPVLVIYIPQLKYGPNRDVSISTDCDAEVYAAAARRAEVAYFDAGPALINVYRKTGQPPHGFPNMRVGVGHLNEAGHQAVADAVAPTIARAARSSTRR